VFLDNLHLMQGWIPRLERKLETAAESAHPGFQCFFSAEPINGAPQVRFSCPLSQVYRTSPTSRVFILLPVPQKSELFFKMLCAACSLQAKIIPESILQMCIKVSNEPPSDMKSNMRRAFAAFTPEAEERLSTTVKRTAYKSILFGLCFYHSLLLGRKKFGTGIGTGEAVRHLSPLLPETSSTTNASTVYRGVAYCCRKHC
jgi:dynein heavy chain